ncbi:MAG: glycosyltransferase [Lachnospiraceae bacterium]|nr:glycosyltransferase [Lachnospiraceae bacterium]
MDYKVSVIFITYNHRDYVEKALRSVLEQETDFPFEVVVGEDCSTDGTQEILKKIAAEYPVHEPTGPSDRQVRLYLREENTGGRPTVNVYETTQRCTGEYLAYLEGDDFWTDRHKLQKQADILDGSPEYIAVTHSCAIVGADDQPIEDEDVKKIGELYAWSGKFTYEDFCWSGKWPGHYATVMSRNIYKDSAGFDYTILYRASDFTDDAVILLFLLMRGDIYRMDECMSAWRYIRKKDGSNWNSIAMSRNIAMEDCYLSRTLMKWVEQYRPLGAYSRKRCLDDFGLALKGFLKKPDRQGRKFLADMYGYGIEHVVMKDQKTSLMGFSIRYILARLGLVKL